MRLLLLLLIASISACKTPSAAYYSTPNDLLKQAGTVYMVNGTARPGRITINFETGREAANFIVLNTEQGAEKVILDSIAYYKIGTVAYHLKKVDVQLNDFKQLLFVKQLTDDSSRVHLYELHQQASKTSDGREYYYYFVSFDQDERLAAQNISSKYFLPNFNEKVSAMFKSCMAVAIKIRNKEKGYFLPAYTLSDQKKSAVWLRIIKEFNECK